MKLLTSELFLRSITMNSQTQHMHSGAFWQWHCSNLCCSVIPGQLTIHSHTQLCSQPPSRVLVMYVHWHTSGLVPHESRFTKSSLNAHAESDSLLPARSCLCLSMKRSLLKCTWCYKRMKSVNQINLKHIGFQACLKWSPNWCVSSTLFIKMAFLMSSCYRNLQSTGQTSTFVYLYHSLFTKEQGFIKEINHLCTV